MTTDDTSRTRDAVVIPFPVRDAVEDDGIPVEDPPDDSGYEVSEFLTPEDSVLAGCPSCGGILDIHTDDCALDVTPDEIIEDGGRWIWVPVDNEPDVEPAVGLVSHRIETMCRWTHRHHMDGVPIPQPCCYPVLITTKRLPGPARQHRVWLAEEEDHPS